jgi:hypothetical protein
MRTGWLSYLRRAYAEPVAEGAGPAVGEAVLVLPDWVKSAAACYEQRCPVMDDAICLLFAMNSNPFRIILICNNGNNQKNNCNNGNIIVIIVQSKKQFGRFGELWKLTWCSLSLEYHTDLFLIDLQCVGRINSNSHSGQPRKIMCIIEQIMRIIAMGRNIRLLCILFTRLPVDARQRALCMGAYNPFRVPPVNNFGLHSPIFQVPSPCHNWK